MHAHTVLIADNEIEVFISYKLLIKMTTYQRQNSIKTSTKQVTHILSLYFFILIPFVSERSVLNKRTTTTATTAIKVVSKTIGQIVRQQQFIRRYKNFMLRFFFLSVVYLFS